MFADSNRNKVEVTQERLRFEFKVCIYKGLLHAWMTKFCKEDW